jgi:hypothetical protein
VLIHAYIQDEFYVSPMMAIRRWNEIPVPESITQSLVQKVKLAIPHSCINQNSVTPLVVSPWTKIFSTK